MFHKKEYKLLNQMLDDALSGEFVENKFDETELSKLQSKLMRFLTSASISEIKIIEEKEKLKQLITDISHQTKTPLTNIIMYSQLLNEKTNDPQVLAFTQEILLQSKKLEELIIGFSKMSRLETGILQYDFKEVLISQILNEAVQQGYLSAVKKDIQIHVEVTKNLKITADKKWIVEAIFNILDNAIKYSNPMTSISIRTFCYELFCGISIIDQGPGIDEDEIPQIFTRFYRGNSSGEKEGIGVGLFLSRKIIEDHGGYIKVKSIVGTGSTFQIFFPILSTLKD